MTTMKTEKEKKTEAVILPITTRQAFKILDEMMSDEEIREALSQTKGEFTAIQHFDLGMWIRNNWIYSDDNEEESVAQRRKACLAMLSGQKEEDFFVFNADMISSAFLERYYDHLKRRYKLG